MYRRSLLLLGLGVLVAAPGGAQGPVSPPGPRRSPIQVEAALRHRDRLQLTEKQVSELRGLREEAVRARQAEITARLELTSRFRAGELTRDEFRKEMRARREAIAPQARSGADRLQATLNETQRAALRDMVREDRREMRARMHRFDGRGRMRRPPREW